MRVRVVIVESILDVFCFVFFHESIPLTSTIHPVSLHYAVEREL